MKLTNRGYREKRYVLLFFTLVILSFCFSSAAADEIEMVSRPVNASGLTGLLVTTSPFTLSPDTIEIGVFALSERSPKPDFSITEYPACISFGMARNMEFSVRGSFFHTEIDKEAKKRGTGDTELSYKWNFMPQSELSSLPGAALIISGIGPTGNDERMTNRVTNWGARLGLAVGTELIWEEHVFGIYADAQVAIQDLSNDQLRDRYHIVNAGLLFPISKHRNLQILIEYTIISGRDALTIDGLDYSAVTPGLRLVGERFNLSIGMQFINKELKEYDDSGRVIGMISVKL